MANCRHGLEESVCIHCSKPKFFERSPPPPRRHRADDDDEKPEIPDKPKKTGPQALKRSAPFTPKPLGGR